MVKINKLICIDEEIHERLQKETNVSQLISNLLKNYYDEQDMVGMSKKEIEKKIALLDLEAEYVKKRKEIENGKI